MCEIFEILIPSQLQVDFTYQIKSEINWMASEREPIDKISKYENLFLWI